MSLRCFSLSRKQYMSIIYVNNLQFFRYLPLVSCSIAASHKKLHSNLQNRNKPLFACLLFPLFYSSLSVPPLSVPFASHDCNFSFVHSGPRQGCSHYRQYTLPSDISLQASFCPIRFFSVNCLYQNSVHLLLSQTSMF